MFDMTRSFEQTTFKSLCLFLYDTPCKDLKENDAIALYNMWAQKYQPEVPDAEAAAWLLEYIRDTRLQLQSEPEKEFFKEALEADGFI